MEQKIFVLGIPIILREWEASKNLPAIFLQNYDFYYGTILKHECVFFRYKGDYLSIPRIKKQLSLVSDLLQTNNQFVLWSDRLASAQQQKMIANGMPFVAGETAIFLPFIGAYIVRSNSKPETPIPEHFTPATQCVFLWILYHNDSSCPVREMMDTLGFSQITIARALTLLCQCGLLTAEGQNTRKRYYSISKKDFWEKGKKYLSSPVRQRVYVNCDLLLDNVETYTAGEEALANLSMLQRPSYPCRAIYKKEFTKIANQVVSKPDFLYDDNYMIIEVWDYNPGHFTTTKIDNVTIDDNVDLFSLWASLGDLLDDVRIETEIENLMEEFFRGHRS